MADRKRSCGPRKSKANPDVYTKEELVELAVEEHGMKKTAANKLSKDALCDLINKKDSVSESESESDEEEKIVKKKKSTRPCGPRKSKNNDAYSKAEVVELAVASGMKKTVANKMKITDLCVEVFGEIVDIKDDSDEKDEEFDYRECKAYTIPQLKKFAKFMGLSADGGKKALCTTLVTHEISKMQAKCLEMNKDDIKDFAKGLGISTSGSKKDVCLRIMNSERAKAGLEEEEDDDNDYELFLREYMDGTSKERAKLLKKYDDILPKRFLKLFTKMSKEEQEEFIDAFLEPENIEKNLSDFIVEFSSRDEEKIEDEFPCISKSKLPLKDYQKRVVKHMLTNRGLIPIFGTGLGKSLTAVTSIQCVLAQDPKIKIVIITPTSLVENMKKEFRAYGADPDDKRITFTTITKFSNDYEAGKIKGNNTFLIVDEAQNLKGHKGKSAKSVIDCAKKAKKVLLLTATPVMNRPNEIINLIAMIDGEDPVTPMHFDRHIMTDDDEFDKFFRCKISYVKGGRNEDYPESEEHSVEFEMDKKYYAAYRDVEKGQESALCTSLFGCGSNLQAFYNGIRRAANNIESEKGPKINWIIDKIQTENKKNKRNKTLIYSSFLDAGSRLVMKRLDKLKIPYAKVDGSMSKTKRKEAVDNYNSGEVNILFISKAGGEGLDLKGTRHVIITEPAWNDANLEQVKGRAVRYKSHAALPEKERRVDIWNLFMIKPPANKRDEDDSEGMESIDIVMRDQALAKSSEIQDFMERLIPLSIENSDCDGNGEEDMDSYEPTDPIVSKCNDEFIDKCVDFNEKECGFLNFSCKNSQKCKSSPDCSPEQQKHMELRILGSKTRRKFVNDMKDDIKKYTVDKGTFDRIWKEGINSGLSTIADLDEIIRSLIDAYEHELDNKLSLSHMQMHHLLSDDRNFRNYFTRNIDLIHNLIEKGLPKGLTFKISLENITKITDSLTEEFNRLFKRYLESKDHLMIYN